MTDFSRFVRILAEDIIPLLEEYCYEDYSVLTQILGKGLVDELKAVHPQGTLRPVSPRGFGTGVAFPVTRNPDLPGCCPSWF